MVYSAGFLFRLENAMQLVRLFHQAHPDLASSKYVASHGITGFDELWVSRVCYIKPKPKYLGEDKSCPDVSTKRERRHWVKMCKAILS